MTIVLVGIKRIAIALDIGLDVFQLVHRGKEIVLEHKQILGVTDVSDIVGYMYLAPSAALRHTVSAYHMVMLMVQRCQPTVIVGLSVLILDLDKELLLV
jgi:hypothetical protein